LTRPDPVFGLFYTCFLDLGWSKWSQGKRARVATPSRQS